MVGSSVLGVVGWAEDGFDNGGSSGGGGFPVLLGGVGAHATQVVFQAAHSTAEYLGGPACTI